MTLVQDVEKLREDLKNVDKVVSEQVKSIDARLTRIEKAFGELTAVADAISKKGVTSRQFVMGILALLVPFVILAITIIVTHG